MTTSLTDVVLAVECLLAVTYLLRQPTVDRWRRHLWCGVFCILGIACVLGAVAHGFAWPETTLAALWKPLYLCLGLVVALFLPGAICDWRGVATAIRFLPWSLVLGFAFFGLTQVMDNGFLLFIGYEAVFMIAALVIYSFLAAKKRLKGAAILAIAILLNLVAAGVQASNLSLTIGVPFDHNGLFHLVQMIAVVTLVIGVRAGLRPLET